MPYIKKRKAKYCLYYGKDSAMQSKYHCYSLTEMFEVMRDMMKEGYCYFKTEKLKKTE